jgi:signal transduction histidine kinase
MDPSGEDARALVAAIERERFFLGGELHGGVCQTLAGTGMLIETLGRAAKNGGPIPLERLEELQRAIDTAIEQLRKLSHDFSPIQLDGTGLMVALFDFAEELSARGKCTIHCEKPVIMSDPAAALNLYHAVREICRVPGNSPPVEFLISLSADQNAISLEVVKTRDLPPQNRALTRLRMRAIGGECMVQTCDETEIITLRVPVQRVMSDKSPRL